jgi:SAM-dependent methyltransferase
MNTHFIYQDHCPLCKSTSACSRILTKDYSYNTSDEQFFFGMCSRCSTYYLINKPIFISSYYPNDYTAYSNKKSSLLSCIRKAYYTNKLQRCLTAHGFSGKSHINVLDYGCASGELMSYIINSNLNCSVYGTDISDRTTSYLSNLEATFIETQNLSLLNIKFDVIYMLQVIEHLDSLSESITLIRNLLSDDGILIIETPSSSGFDFHLFPRHFWGGWHAPRHFFVSNKLALSSFLQTHGYRILSFKYIWSPYIWAETLKVSSKPYLRAFFSITNIAFLCIVAFLDQLQIWLRLPTSNMQFICSKNSKSV